MVAFMDAMMATPGFREGHHDSTTEPGDLQVRVVEWAARARPNATAHTLQSAIAERAAQPEALERHHLAEMMLVAFEIAEHLEFDLAIEMERMQSARELSSEMRGHKEAP